MYTTFVLFLSFSFHLHLSGWGYYFSCMKRFFCPKSRLSRLVFMIYVVELILIFWALGRRVRLHHHLPPPTTTHHHPKYINHHPPPAKIYPAPPTTILAGSGGWRSIHYPQPPAKIYLPPPTTHHQPKYIHQHPPPPTDSQNISPPSNTIQNISK